MYIRKAQLGMSIIDPRVTTYVAPQILEKVSDKISELDKKVVSTKAGKLISDFLYGKDHELSNEEYLKKYGFGKPMGTDLGIAGMVSPSGAISAIKGAGKIIDLNKISKATLTLSEPEKYITLMHGTAPKHIPSIMAKGFEVPGGNILSTATLESGNNPKRIFDFFKGLGNVGQANNGAAAIIRIPVKELPGLQRGIKVADAIDDVFMGSDGITRIPSKYITGFYKTQIKKCGGVLSGKSGIHIKPENRGKFTRLKKRTGKSSTWYKERGTPAQKKMAIFALNARKWKH